MRDCPTSILRQEPKRLGKLPHVPLRNRPAPRAAVDWRHAPEHPEGTQGHPASRHSLAPAAGSSRGVSAGRAVRTTTVPRRHERGPSPEVALDVPEVRGEPEPHRRGRAAVHRTAEDEDQHACHPARPRDGGCRGSTALDRQRNVSRAVRGGIPATTSSSRPRTDDRYTRLGSRSGSPTEASARACRASGFTTSVTRTRRAARKAGIPAKVVSQRLGHASITITIDTYPHVESGTDQQAANDVASAILG